MRPILAAVFSLTFGAGFALADPTSGAQTGTTPITSLTRKERKAKERDDSQYVETSGGNKKNGKVAGADDSGTGSLQEKITGRQDEIKNCFVAALTNFKTCRDTKAKSSNTKNCEGAEPGVVCPDNPEDFNKQCAPEAKSTCDDGLGHNGKGVITFEKDNSAEVKEFIITGGLYEGHSTKITSSTDPLSNVITNYLIKNKIGGVQYCPSDKGQQSCTYTNTGLDPSLANSNPIDCNAIGALKSVYWRDACAKTGSKVNTSQLLHTASQTAGQMATSNAGQLKASDGDSVAAQSKTAANAAGVAAASSTTNALANGLGYLQLTKHLNQLQDTKADIEQQIKEAGYAAEKEGDRKTKAPANDAAWNAGHLAKLRLALVEANKAIDATTKARSASMMQAATAMGNATKAGVYAAQMKKAAKDLETPTGAPMPTVADPSLNQQPAADSTQLQINNNGDGSSNTTTYVKKDPAEKTDTTPDAGNGVATGTAQDYGDTPSVLGASPGPDGGAGGGGAAKAGGGGGGGAPGGGGGAAAKLEDDGSGKNPQLAGAYGGSDKYESAGKPKGGGSGGGSGSGSGGSKEDGIDFNSMLAKFLPGGDKAVDPAAAGGIQAKVNGDRSPASAEDSFLGEQADIFANVAKTYAEKAARNEVSAE